VDNFNQRVKENKMKKALSMLCVVLVIGFAGTAFAKKMPKVGVCHNGSEYIGNTEVHEPEMWEDRSFVINISENAVQKHLDNHWDSKDYTLDQPVITEVMYDGDGKITDYEMQQSCVINEPDPEPTD